MGSFANSLHVKCEDAARVVAAIRELLAGGWKETEAAVARAACTAANPTARELHVSTAVGGWVSVLDSDLTHLEELTQEVAAHLGTRALLCFVDDSASWSYQLAGPNGPAGQFDSAELPEFDPAIAPPPPSTPMTRMQALMKEDAVQDRMQQIQAEISADAPPEIRAAEDRVRNRQGTPDDAQQVRAYSLSQLPKYMPELRALLGGAMTSPPDLPPPTRKPLTPQEQAAQEKRLNDLRPILAAGVTDGQVQAVLSRRGKFAEEDLAAFLPLVGIQRYYANLSYDYLEDAPPADLTSHQIQFVHSLRFQRTTAKSKAKKRRGLGNK